MLSLSPAFPQTSKCIHSTIKSFSPFAHAYYILGRHPLTTYQSQPPRLKVSDTLSSALRYPITTLAVLEALYSIISRSKLDFHTRPNIELPERLFRSLGTFDAARDGNSDPLPILRFLWEDHRPKFLKPETGSQDGYPLFCAVEAQFIPLVEFLLDHGAEPGDGDCFVVRMAIMKNDLELVKMLMERLGTGTWSPMNKIQSLQDFKDNNFLPDLAVRFEEQDIFKYLVEELQFVP